MPQKIKMYVWSVCWDPSGQSKPWPKECLVCFGGSAPPDHFESPLAENNICVVGCLMPHMNSIFLVPSLQCCTDFRGHQTGVLMKKIFLNQCKIFLIILWVLFSATKHVNSFDFFLHELKVRINVLSKAVSCFLVISNAVVNNYCLLFVM